MDILQSVAVELPCNQCGHRYHVTLAQVLVSQDALTHECLARGDGDCEPLFAARLLDHDLIEKFRDAWDGLANAARASGGVLGLQDRAQGA